MHAAERFSARARLCVLCCAALVVVTLGFSSTIRGLTEVWKASSADGIRKRHSFTASPEAQRLKAVEGVVYATASRFHLGVYEDLPAPAGSDWLLSPMWRPLDPLPPPPLTPPGASAPPTEGSVIRATHILMIGDSVDRTVVQRYCQFQGVPESGVTEWGAGVFSYKFGQSTQICTTAWGSIASLHTFGASPEPPYFLNEINGHDEWYATPIRLSKALHVYRSRLGYPPTVILFQQGLWDLSFYGGRGPMSADRMMSAIHQFREDFSLEVRHLQSLQSSAIHGMQAGAAGAVAAPQLADPEEEEEQDVFPRTTTLLLRTTPVMPLLQLQTQFNDVIREAARAWRIPLLDWDALTRGQACTPGLYANMLTPDDHHPTPKHMLAFGKQVVEFSRWIDQWKGSML